MEDAVEEYTRNQDTVGPIEELAVTAKAETVQNPEQLLQPMVVAHAPMAVAGNVYLGQTAMDQPFTFTREQLLASSTGPRGDVLIAGLVDVNPAVGIVTDNGDGTWTYSPVAGFTGDDVQISFTVSDGNGGIASARALLDVTASVNRPPVTGNVDLGSMEEDGTLTFSAAQLLSGSPDTDGEALTITAVTVNPHYGLVTDNGDGTWTFTPSENFHDFDVPLIFAVENGNGDTDTAVALVDVIAAPCPPETYDVAPAPIEEDQTLTFSADQLLSNTYEANNERLVTSVTVNPAYGDIVDNGDGTWSFAPAENFHHEDIFLCFAVEDKPDRSPAPPSSRIPTLSPSTFRAAENSARTIFNHNNTYIPLERRSKYVAATQRSLSRIPISSARRFHI
ncbi:MAG: hypothetical protein CVU60_04760 [Deltaproteobacteria bacterium HGW-Deltaproteobacteria-18]|jgi:hypothetical protein|nr:MAG: hypothetical protein CVU60_04760 [Deltaproteobacteria bacterium HGW-Deltaproteobacteria-18]